MLWPNLKNMKCPKCGNKIQAIDGFYKCDGCPFKISFGKFDEAVQAMYSGQRVQWMEDAEGSGAVNFI